MFFPRLRRHARWAFALMVLVFGLGFVFLGIGSGSSGIGDLLQGHFSDIFHGGSSATSISGLQGKVAKNPKDAHSWRLLGDQLDAKHRSDEAIRAYARYVGLLKKPSTDVLERLGALQFQRGSDYQQLAYAAQQEASPGVLFAPPSSTKLGQALGNDPIASAASSSTQTTVTNALSASQRNFTGAASTYKQLAGRRPTDPLVQQELGYASEASGNTKGAIAAYTAFLRLASDSADAPVIRQRLKALQAQAAVKPVVTPKKSGR